MKLSKIKTREQFNEMADVQYQRTIRLADAMNDTTKNPFYRMRAAVIWFKSMKRVQKLISIYAKMSTQKREFPSGGFVNKAR